MLSNITIHQTINSLLNQNTSPLLLDAEQRLGNKINLDEIASNSLNHLDNSFAERAQNRSVIENVNELNGRVSVLASEEGWGDWVNMVTQGWKDWAHTFIQLWDSYFKDPNACSLSDKSNELRLANPTSALRYNTFNVTALERNTFAHAIPPSPYQYLHVMDRLQADEGWLKEVDESISDPSCVMLQNEGISGSYLIKNKNGAPIGIFKSDNQVGESKNNLEKLGLSEFSILGCAGEYMARLIGGDFCSVPELHVVQVFLDGRLQLGSLQKYIVNDGDAEKFFLSTKDTYKICGIDPAKNDEDLTPEERSKLSTIFSDPKTRWQLTTQTIESDKAVISKIASSIQRLAILDMLIQNSDRVNPKNLLYKDHGDRYELIPIDHNLAFPDEILLLSSVVVWLRNPVLKKSLEKESINFVRELNLDKISNEMQRLGMSQAQIGVFKLMGTFLKLGIENNLSLYELAVLLLPSEPHDLSLSIFQKLVFIGMVDIHFSNQKLEISQILPSKELLKKVQEKLKPMFHQIRDDINRQGGSEYVVIHQLLENPEILSDYFAWKSMYDRAQSITMEPKQPKCPPNLETDANESEKHYHRLVCTTKRSKQPECYPMLKEIEERYHLHQNGTCTI